jgi:hypothetical protein
LRAALRYKKKKEKISSLIVYERNLRRNQLTEDPIAVLKMPELGQRIEGDFGMERTLTVAIFAMCVVR